MPSTSPTPAPTPTLDSFLERARPHNPGVSDEELTAYWQETYAPPPSPHDLPTFESFLKQAKPLNPEHSDAELKSYWQDEYGSKGAQEKASSLFRRAADVPLGIAKGAADIPSVLGGLVDIPTGGAYSRGKNEILGILGKDADALGLPRWARPSQWSEMLAESYSPETKAAVAGASEETRKAVKEAKAEGAGIPGQLLAEVTGTAKGLYEHPAALVPLISENLAQMGVIAKGVSLALKPLQAVLDAKIAAGVLTADEANTILGKAAIRASSIGEGLQSAGQISSQMDPDAGTVNRLAAAAAGVGTALITRGVGKIPGMGDAEATLATKLLGHETGFTGSLPVRIGKGMLAEGVLQEPAQSSQEQIWQNVAEGKPWHEGVGEQAVQGAAAGMAMGGGAAAFGRSRQPDDALRHAAPIIAAQGVDDAIKQAQDVTGQPGVTPEVLDQFIARQAGEGKQIAEGQTEEAQRIADQAMFVDVMAGFGSKNISTDATGQTTFQGTPLKVVMPSELPDVATMPNEMTRAKYDVLNLFAKALNKHLIIFQDDPQFKLPSGVVNRPNYPDVVFLARDSKAVDHFSVFVHEAFHLMTGTEFHTEFLKAVFEQLTPEAKTLAVKRHGALSDEKLLNEVASDVAGTELHKPELWTKVVQNLTERVGEEEAKAQILTFIDHLKEIIAKIKAVIVSQPWGPRRPGAMDKRTLAEQYLKDVTKVHDALAAGVADALYHVKHGTVAKRAERGKLELQRRMPKMVAPKKTTSKVIGSEGESADYFIRTNAFLKTSSIPAYAKQAIMSQEMAARTNKKLDLHLSDAKWERKTVFLEDIRKQNEILWKQPSPFQHRVAMTQGPIVLDRAGTIIDGNNRVWEAIRRGDSEIGVIRPVASAEPAKKKPTTPLEKLGTEPANKKVSTKTAEKLDKKYANVVEKPGEKVDKKPEPVEKQEETKPVLIADLHDLADARGIPWDDDNKFMDLTERTTGKRHLDDLTQAERVLMAEKIKETPITKAPKKESTASRVTVALEHYSREEGLSEINPKFHGRGQIGAERRRMENEGQDYLPRSYFYRAGTAPEPRFTGLTKYTASIPASRLVDLATLTGTPTEREQEAKKEGYLGFFNSESSQPDAVALFEPIRAETTKKVSRISSERQATASPAEPWFSTLQKTLEAKMPTKASKTQVRNILNSPGVKEDEIKWSGIQDYLEKQPDIIDKHNLLAWLAAHNVQVKEVVKQTRQGRPFHESTSIQDFTRRWGATEGIPDSNRYFYPHLDFPNARLESGVPDGGFVVIINNRYLSPDGELYDEESEFPSFHEASEAAYEYLVAEPGRFREEQAEELDLGTQYEGYKLPGGTNYTELLLTLPSERQAEFQRVRDEADRQQRANRYTELKLVPTPEDFRSPHFTEPNILAHVRFDTRQDGAGKNVLFLEEVQSDWHEQGREKGYLIRFTGEERKAIQNTIRKYPNLGQNEDWSLQRLENAGVPQELRDRWWSAFMAKDADRVPEAPFSKTWPELVLKRMLRWASEHNYDRLAWTTGAQQNERYGLAKTGVEISYFKNDELEGIYSGDTYNVRVNNSTGRSVYNNSNASIKELEGLVGKELTQKIVNNEGAPQIESFGKENLRVKILSGLDLEIGGSGMKYFYDQMLPRVLEKYLKRFGTKVDALVLEDGAGSFTNRMTVHSIALTQDMKDSVLNEGQPLFSPAQIPSGVPTAGKIAPGYAIEPPGKLDKMIRVLQDKNIDIKRIVEAIQAAGLEVPDELNPVYREEMYQKRTEQRAKDFTVDELRPLTEAMRLHKISLEQLDEYAHARHVIEDDVNARLKALNPTMPNNDALSGLTDAQAQNILANSNKPVMDSLMRRVDDMVEKTRDLMVSYGLEKQSTIDQWRQEYSAYVPLHREGFEEEGYPTGTGRSVRGSTVKRRGGSTLRVENILANIAQARDQILTRGEKQKPVVAFASLMMLHPNPQIAILDKPAPVTMTNPVTGLTQVVPGNLTKYQVPTVRRFDPVSQTYHMVPDPLYKGRDNVVNFRLKGIDYAIVFNEQNERAMEVAKAFKELDTAKLNIISQALAPYTRYLAAINTQYNPIFGIVNFVRDAQFAMLTLQSTPLAGKQLEVLNNARKSLAGIYQDARDVRLGIAPTSPMAKLWKRFEEVGGPTGYRDLFKTSTERAEEIERMLDPKSWKKIKNPIDLGKRLEETPMFQWLSDYNLTMENAIRLGVFKAGIDAGMSDLKAASLAKNITVNFNKKGQFGALMGSLYAFFNANVQGSARIGETLFERTPALFDQQNRLLKPSGFKISALGKKIIVGGIALGVLQTFALAMAGFDDHDPPDFVKQKNFVYPAPWTKKGYAMIPMPLGFNLLPNVGRLAAETVMNAVQGRPPKIMEKAASFFSTLFNTISPTGGSGSILLEPVPTALDPFFSLGFNKDWTGRAIYKEDFSSHKPTPGFTRAHDTASAWAKGLAYAINWATGGTDYVPGILSPTPDAIDYLITTATGGVGREVSKMAQVAQSVYTGEELPAHKIPLAGRFVGSATGSSAVRTRFYQNVRDANMAYQEYEGRATHKEPFSDYVKTHPEARFAKAALETERDLGVLNKQKQAMLERGATKEAIKLQEARILGLMTRFNDLVERAQRPQS